MKTKILSTIALLFGLFMTAKAQNNNWNYVHTRTMLTATADSYMDNVVYYDGLGRPFQNAQLHAAPNGQSIVDFTEYDASGRVWRQWNKAYTAGEFMPYEGISLSYPYIYNDSRCYAETVYDGSPLDRVTKQYGPGNAWSSHPVQTDYMVNNGTTAELKCLYYSVNTDGTLNANNGASYPTGSLHVVKTTDEDGNVGYVFTDKQGRTLLERRMNGAVAHDTYYVYDVYSNLCFVLQPMYQDSNNVDLFAFQYKYDHRNRCIWKKLPGTGYVEYVYNNADQLTYSQDGNQRTNGQWTYYVYDNLNRLTEQGLSYGKTTSGTVMVKNYYDDYSFVTAESLGGYYVQGTEPANGLLTASVITTEGGSGEKVYYAYYYDEKGRLVKTVHTPLRGGIYLANTSYTFTDKPLQEQRIYFHGESGVAPIVEYIDYSYDSSDRLQKITHQRMGVSGLAAVELVSYTYDNLGRMSAQSFHNGGYNNTYGYNVRGWLTNIGGNNFMQSLTYNNGTTGFNGNITAMNWTANGSSHSYSFTYDGMNRMLNATHGTGAYTEKVTSYDKNGNILALQRYGNGLIDNLAYTYNGNRLTQVEDATGNASGFKNGASQANEYTYDNNGNLTKDSNKGIASITYNSLNLPKKITYSDGGSVTYLYGADGKKYRTIHVIGGVTTTTEYIGNLVYVNNTPQKILTEVGYMDLTDNTYYYYLKDHQGNNRVVLSSSGTVMETNHYYPFGGVFASSSVQPYKYNGKELDTKAGLNWYDYGARHYDAALGRFMTQDRFAEKYSFLSPYQYGANSPVCNVDVNGDSIVILHHKEGLHMGMLIQNDVGKWQYYSVNGDNVYISGKFLGGRQFDDLGLMAFNSPQEFLDSKYNSAGEDLSTNGYGYAEGYVIPTTTEQDELMSNTFKDISKTEEYNLLTNNCTTVVQRTMDAAGLKTTSPIYFPLGKAIIKVPKNPDPRSSFKMIIKNNPNGMYIHRLK